MRHSRARAIALVAAAALVVPQVSALAQRTPNGASRFERLGDLGAVSGFKPALLSSDRPVRVIVQVKGRSVARAQAQARRQGRSLSAQSKSQIRRSLRQDQARVEQSVRAAGGQVGFRYQTAYNGFSATVPASQIAALEARPDVVQVHPTRIFKPDNVPGVQYIRGNQAWADLGFTGEGTKVAVIDTGVDYTHANFGGPGTPEAFDNNDGTVIEPGTFPTAKVAGGTDIVGDDYDADSDDPANTVPHPDPDPLDCNGHGSHVAGSAAGFGVLGDGSTFNGPYDGTTYENNFRIGPGVAPEALIYAYRVFGCEGSANEDVIVEAIDSAVADGADVINMSLGSPFGRKDEPSAQASDAAALAGTVVVASAGNSGPNAYITGSPAAASRALSVAAIDGSSPTFPGAALSLPGGTVNAINANGADLPAGPLPVAVLRDSYPGGPVSLGCDPAEYADYPGGVQGKLVVTVRGTCARVARAIFGEQAGAAAVAMINTDSGFPPFEGRITSNPDTGEEFEVTIPFLGVRGCLASCPGDTTDPETLVSADAANAGIAPTTVPNPGYQRLASFSSGGPANVDSAVKPEVSAPGVSVLSTGSGTGDQGAVISGTSMASPMTAGSAALVTDAHPDWSTDRIKAALVNTANASTDRILGYNERVAGAGVVDARRAVDTAVVATTSDGSDSLSFGAKALAEGGSDTLSLTLDNTGGSAVRYSLSPEFNGADQGAAVSVSPSSVTVPPRGSKTVDVTLSFSDAAAAALPGATRSNFGALQNARGAIVATPSTEDDGIYPLRTPFFVAPRGLSDVAAEQPSGFEEVSDGVLGASVPVSNDGIHAGTADVYAWGIEDAADVPGGEGSSLDIRTAGVQTLPRAALCGDAPAGQCGTANDRSLVFAVNMDGAWSTPAVNEVDVAIDTRGNSRPEFFVVGVDFGAVSAGSFDGRFASVIFDADGNLVDAWVAAAPMNTSTMLLPTLASEVGMPRNATFNYSVASFSIVPEGLTDTTDTAVWESHETFASSGDFLSLGPGESDSVDVAVESDVRSDILGWMFVTHDDAAGTAQADTVAGPR